MGTIPQAVIEEREYRVWTMENGVIRAIITFMEGKVDMISLYNKSAGKEYLSGAGERTLFCYSMEDGTCVSAKDSIWTLKAINISDIVLYDRSWGKKLEVTVFCEKPKKVQVRLGFEIYHDDGGIRYQCHIKNCEEKNLTIEKADVIKLNFPDETYTAYYVPNMSWEETRGSLNGTRNCIMVYDSRDG